MNDCTCNGEGRCLACQRTDRIVYHSATGGEPTCIPTRRRVVFNFEPTTKTPAGARCAVCRALKPPDHVWRDHAGRELWAHRECLPEQ